MKITFLPVFPVPASLGVIALSFLISSAHAQTVLHDAEESQPAARTKKVSLLVDLGLSDQSAPSVADAPVNTDKYRLHASDRAHRGQIDATELRGPAVLPDLPADVPASSSRQKFAVVSEEPRSGE